jgi:hypothetical protein
MVNTLSKNVSDILNNKDIMGNLISKVSDTIKQTNPEMEQPDLSGIEFTPEMVKETIDKNMVCPSEDVVNATNGIINSSYMEKLAKDFS